MSKLKIALLTAVMLTVICLSGCSSATIENEGSTQKSSMFVEIERTGLYKVVYHKETKVMYAVSFGGYNGGNFTLLVNADGTPMIWEGRQ